MQLHYGVYKCSLLLNNAMRLITVKNLMNNFNHLLEASKFKKKLHLKTIKEESFFKNSNYRHLRCMTKILSFASPILVQYRIFERQKNYSHKVKTLMLNNLSY